MTLLTNDEAELYDRQIRLWGVNAQTRLRQSRVLMIGMTGVASEVAKILVLAGINELTVVDDEPLNESDLYSNLFCRPPLGAAASEEGSAEKQPFRTHQVADKLKILNPQVKVTIDNSSILSKEPDFFSSFDLVTLHSFLPSNDIFHINRVCREKNIKFYMVLDYGFFGFMFNDLGEHYKFTYDDFAKTDKDKKSAEGDITSTDVIPVPSSGEGSSTSGVGVSVPQRGDSPSSDNENNPPKKRRRINSAGSRDPEPNKTTAAAAATEDEKVSKVESLPYVDFQQVMLNSKSSSTTGGRGGAKVSPVFVISLAIIEFFSLQKCLPRNSDATNRREDLEKLNQIIESLKKTMDLNESIFKKLPHDWSDNIYGSLSPVCAVVGGVAGQDMIRALSETGIPTHNTFTFDGLSMNGTVQKVGLEASKLATVEPVVRDFFQIDDDDD